MKGFMSDVFLSYGVTPDRAEICSKVLIEANKHGIDLLGLRRLKPIYYDRMDRGIHLPNASIEIVSKCKASALVMATSASACTSDRTACRWQSTRPRDMGWDLLPAGIPW
jgi:LDH2 family malate/lactate/ureidoglycolate dehydrogenase